MLEYGKQKGQVQFEVNLQFHSMDLTQQLVKFVLN